MKSYQPLKAIRAKCLECSGNRPLVVRHCQSVDCPLHAYRLGKNPKRQGIGVGIRENNGRFKKIVTAQAAGFKPDGSATENFTHPGSLEDSGGQNGSGKIDLISRGQVAISRENGKDLLIRVTIENQP